MNESTPQLKPYHCRSCELFIGYRRGNTLIYAGLEITFKRSQDMVCPHCKSNNRFFVDTQRLSGVKLG